MNLLLPGKDWENGKSKGQKIKAPLVASDAFQLKHKLLLYDGLLVVLYHPVTPVVFIAKGFFAVMHFHGMDLPSFMRCNHSIPAAHALCMF